MSQLKDNSNQKRKLHTVEIPDESFSHLVVFNIKFNPNRHEHFGFARFFRIEYSRPESTFGIE